MQTTPTPVNTGLKSALAVSPLIRTMRAMRAMPAIAACLAAAMVLGLGGCALAPQTPQTPPTTAQPKRTVAQLQSLRTSDFKAAMASASGEQNIREVELKNLRAALALPAGPLADEKLPGALDAVALFNAEKPAALKALLAALPTLAQKPAPYQRALLTSAHTLFWAETAPLVKTQLPLIATPREFAIAAYTLLRADSSAANREALRQQLNVSFSAWASEPRLIALERRLRMDRAADLVQRPPLVDLLAAPLKPGLPVVFSLQRSNRERIGLAVVRGPDGRFVRNPDGSVFSIAQLAYARSNLPGTITNGNTPQGIFTIRGTGTATVQWLGPTPFLESKIPLEGSLAEFDHDEPQIAAQAALAAGRADLAKTEADKQRAAWTPSRYAAFFPATWKNYWPVTEAFLAGQAGRDDMLLHGNTVNPAYYLDEPFYPAAPTAGCLLAMEYWSKEDGSLVQSDQLALVKAFVSGGKDNGYLIVVDIDDRDRPVSLADVVDQVMAAEAQFLAVAKGNNPLRAGATAP